LLAAAAMGAAALGVHDVLTTWLPGDEIGVQMVRLGSAIATGLLVLAGAAWLLRIREFTRGVALVTRRFR